MPTDAWKNAERQTASYFGCRRNPGSGAFDHHSTSDTLSKKFYLEIKLRAKSALWTLFRSVRLKAAKEQRVPVIAYHAGNTPGFLVVVHSDDLPKFVCKYLELYGYELDPSTIYPMKSEGSTHPAPPPIGPSC